LFCAAPAAVVNEVTMLLMSSPEPIPVDVTTLPPEAVAAELDDVEGITELIGTSSLAPVCLTASLVRT
jgi:hypothetical protein